MHAAVSLVKDFIYGTKYKHEKQLCNLVLKNYGETILRIEPQKFQHFMATDLDTLDEHQMNSFLDFVKELVEIAEEEIKKCEKIVVDWRRCKEALQKHNKLELNAYLDTVKRVKESKETPVQSAVSQHTANMKKQENQLKALKEPIMRHLNTYKINKLRILQAMHDKEKREISENTIRLRQQCMDSLDALSSASLVNLYVIPILGGNVIDSIQNSSVRKLCNSISEWQEDGDVSQLISPFLVLHCIFVDQDISAPSESLRLFYETEKRGGGYLVMRIHSQKHLFYSDGFDIEIPSGIGELATVLKAQCQSKPDLANGGFQREFIDTLQCLEPPTGCTQDLKRNLYFLIARNNLVLNIRMEQISAFRPPGL